MPAGSAFLLLHVLFMLMFCTFNTEICIPRSVAGHWDHIFLSVLGVFECHLTTLKDFSSNTIYFFSGN